jgi:hypothetical protein
LSNAKNACEKMTGLADEGKKTCLRNNWCATQGSVKKPWA